MAPTADESTVEIEVVALPAAGVPVAVPDNLDAILTVGMQRVPATIRCAPAARGEVAPANPATRQCQLRLPNAVTASEASGETTAISLSLDEGVASPHYLVPSRAKRLAVAAPAVAPAGEETAIAVASEAKQAKTGIVLAPSEMPSAKGERGNAFLENLSAYKPIYAAYGPGTNSEGRIQISFKYQLFGDPGDVGLGAPLANGLHFAYTQRMFWDLGADSSPFRNIDFMPEIFYLQPAVEVGDGLSLGGQLGLRHESNGRDGEASRSANTVYIQPVASVEAGDYTVSFGPRLFFYVGDLSDNPDIRHYRGSTGLFAEIGKDDGLRLTTTSRMNFSSGKAAINGELSYPMDNIIETGLNLYLFGQAFTGYGENLLDYNRKVTRLRFGVSIVR
ncbi:phospholipase [Novosphingobium sp. BW1]|nr:phospholipase [Novosphingobium sp. BW1]